MQSPIYNYSNFKNLPAPVFCKRCGQKTLLAQRKTGQLFTVDETTTKGEFKWHVCQVSKIETQKN